MHVSLSAGDDAEEPASLLSGEGQQPPDAGDVGELPLEAEWGDEDGDGDGDGDGKTRRAPAPAPPMEEGLHMFATLLKMFIGSGVLFLPRAFANGGWLFSSVAMAFCALITGVCILRLVECRQAVRGSYGYLGFRAAGVWGRRAVDASVVLSQAGFCCVYSVFPAFERLSAASFPSSLVRTLRARRLARLAASSKMGDPMSVSALQRARALSRPLATLENLLLLTTSSSSSRPLHPSHHPFLHPADERLGHPGHDGPQLRRDRVRPPLRRGGPGASRPRARRRRPRPTIHLHLLTLPPPAPALACPARPPDPPRPPARPARWWRRRWTRRSACTTASTSACPA